MYNFNWTADKSTPSTCSTAESQYNGDTVVRDQREAGRGRRVRVGPFFVRRPQTHVGLGMLVSEFDGPDAGTRPDVQDAPDPGAWVVGRRGAEAAVEGTHDEVVLQV